MDRVFGDPLPDSFQYHNRIVITYIGGEGDKCACVVSCYHIGLTHLTLQQRRDCLKNLVACLDAVFDCELIEVIDLQHCHRQADVTALCAGVHFFADIKQVVTVVDTGQSIPDI